MKSRHNLAKKASSGHLEILPILRQSFPAAFTLAQAVKVLNSSPRTVSRRLNEFIKNGSIQQYGKGRATYYRITGSNEKPTSRTAIGYNSDLLENYIPNKTYFLSKMAREQMTYLGQRPGDTNQIETFAAEIYERLLIDLSWSSSKLEGNTYSILETEKLLNEQLEAKGKDQIETQMILNHKEAISFLLLNRADIDINSITSRNIHALLSEDLLADPANGGRVRGTPVGIDGTTYIPLNNPHTLEEQFDLFLKKAQTIKDPFEQSFFSMVFIPYIQPFIDLNKRTSRVIANIPFVKNNLSPLSFNDTDRDQYIRAMISIYEKNDITLLKALYIDAYTSSAERYRVTKNSLVAPHPLKIKYRSFIRQGVAQLIRTLKNKANDLNFKPVDPFDRETLIKLIDIELQSLHEGNFAKFEVLPSEFQKWAKKFHKK